MGPVRQRVPRSVPFKVVSGMDELLNALEAARRLGIRSTTLYDWLGSSRRGLLEIRGQRVTIEYFQGGPKGQGRIFLEAAEVERIREFMRVRQTILPVRRAPIRRAMFPGITVPLGRPDRNVG